MGRLEKVERTMLSSPPPTMPLNSCCRASGAGEASREPCSSSSNCSQGFCVDSSGQSSLERAAFCSAIEIYK